jgi:hypothetical protein
MPPEDADQLYLLAREADLWHAEATDRTQNRLDDLQEGSPEWVKERAWYDYCVRKYAEVAGESDKIQNPEKYWAAHHGRESLDDLDRQTE